MGIAFASGQDGEGGAKSSNVGGNNEDLSAWNGIERLPRYRGLHQGWDFELVRLSRDRYSLSESDVTRNAN